MTDEIKPQSTGWKEYDDFYSAHEMQLYGMSFPKEASEKLYVKLKNELFNTNDFFEILDNQDECRYMLKAKQDIKKNMEVYLIDHSWTYRIREYNTFCEKYPNIINRCMQMLKYGNIKKDILSIQKDEKPSMVKDINSVNAMMNKENKYKYIDYDETGLCEQFDQLMIKEQTETLSIEDNNVENVHLIYELLDKYKNIKGLWVRNNPFEEANDDYVEYIHKHYPQIELLNRKLTPNAKQWAIDYLSNLQSSEEWARKYNSIFGKEKVLDLSDRHPFIISDPSAIYSNAKDINIIDLTDNDYDFCNKEHSDQLLQLLKVFPSSLNKLIVDEDFSLLLSEDKETSIFTNTELLKDILKLNNVKYINEYSIEALIERANDIKQYKKEIWVLKYMWKINRTYRLVTSEKFDEEPIWYINDEFGSAINHSDMPNMAMSPFIFSKSNTFAKDELITYSILWPIKDIKKGEEIYIDYLKNITENEERSLRLTCWYHTPKEYFINKFKARLTQYNTLNIDETIAKYKQGVSNLLQYKGDAIDEEIKKVCNFNQPMVTKQTLDAALDRIKLSLSLINSNNISLNDYLSNILLTQKKIKVITDLPYVRENLKLKEFEFTEQINEADIIWSHTNIFSLLENKQVVLKCFKDNKAIVFMNQFPFESVISMKSHLANLIQANAGVNSIMHLSYEMNTELAEIIGNYYHNEDNNYDNTWILKPINMTRSMDMVITNNLAQIIRNVETGPKICQKYIHRPFLMNKNKIDLRFIILLKRLIPLELYFYSKMFWIRSANKPFTMEPKSFNDYEVHFTVMNYATCGMQTIYNTDFEEYLKKNGIEWSAIYDKIKKQMETVFLLAGKDCPQMTDAYSRAIYGLDTMIDEDLEPHVVEINYQPDCTRACKFVPEFYDDIFSTLFLNKPSGVELV